MKVLIMTDLEGVAGVTTFKADTSPEGLGYKTAKILLTEEVNAAVRGFLEAGATEVLVVDGHGSGAVEYERLAPPAKLLHGRPLKPIKTLKDIFRRHDITAMVGQHAMAGIPDGNLNHTQSSESIDYYKLNGVKIGETAQWSLFCGALGIPLVLFSGDKRACEEAEGLLQGVATAPVKEGVGRNCAISLPASEARALIQKQARAALKKHMETPSKPLIWKGPFELEARYFHTDAADAMEARPGAVRVDAQTVRLASDDITEIIY